VEAVTDGMCKMYLSREIWYGWRAMERYRRSCDRRPPLQWVVSLRLRPDANLIDKRALALVRLEFEVVSKRRW
jgi:hypothetical protein